MFGVILITHKEITVHIKNTCKMTSFTYLIISFRFNPSLCNNSNEYPDGG